ncbi:hypothetical protein BJF85_13370 [Saccharomonospora sp. CUA-673]|uniref:anti-sigma factor family protein n=1 Tax=Saccharomonospora sp. CUA-673 TaxID=1904969 RepID=UPI0009695CE3|nr:hypothetical protein BJF85_13370 [Saccharomonospora sp. CUA-673]
MSRQLGFGLPESHLLPDAVVAFVDNEMSPAATERAAEHVAHCPWCAADVDAQRQVRAAVQDAREPSMSAGFLASCGPFRRTPTSTPPRTTSRSPRTASSSPCSGRAGSPDYADGPSAG